MDLNDLYHRQQVEMMRADAAAGERARAAHKALADVYGRRIDDARRRARVEAGA